MTTLRSSCFNRSTWLDLYLSIVHASMHTVVSFAKESRIRTQYLTSILLCFSLQYRPGKGLSTEISETLQSEMQDIE